MNNLQSRIEELDRLGTAPGGGSAVGFETNNNHDPFGPSELLDLGENRNRDWGFLEALFGEGEIATGRNQRRRRTALPDILSGMSMRMLIEREERRRRERGSRLLAALKETSMVRD